MLLTTTLWWQIEFGCLWSIIASGGDRL